MSEWQSGKLGDFITLQRGYDITQKEMIPGLVPVISSGGITGYHKQAIAKGPGVITGRKGTLGRVFYVDVDYWPHDTTLWVRDFKGNHPRFVYYFLQTLNFLRMDVGTSNPTLNRNHVHPLPVLWPPLDEQREIARILGAFDDKIEANRRLNQTLEAAARALFKSWFVDFDPVHAKARGEQPPGLDAATAALFPDSFEESALGPIPRGWGVGRLGDVAENYDSKRIPLSKREREKRWGNYPYYGAASVMDYIDDYLFDGVHLLMAEDGSVRDNNGYPVLQYVWGQFWVNNHAHVLRGKNSVSTEQVYLTLQLTQIDPYVTGAVQPKINQANMNRIPVVLAAEQVNKAFQLFVEPLFAQMRARHDESRTLAAARDALLPKLVSGSVRV